MIEISKEELGRTEDKINGKWTMTQYVLVW